LGVAALEDKIVQQAVVTILNQIYEEDFLGFSCGFRPGRSQHDAVDVLSYALLKKKVNSAMLSSAYRMTITSPCAHFWRQTFTQRSKGMVETSLDDCGLCGALRSGSANENHTLLSTYSAPFLPSLGQSALPSLLGLWGGADVVI